MKVLGLFQFHTNDTLNQSGQRTGQSLISPMTHSPLAGMVNY